MTYLQTGMHFARRVLDKNRRLVFGESAENRRYLTQRYFAFTGRLPDLNHPQGFLEKLLWLNLNYRDPAIPPLVDKWLAREQVTARVGAHVLTELIGVWNTPRQIPFADLPKQFVLKATAGSGWNIICHDKSELDIPLSIAKLQTWQNRNYYHRHREWQYRPLRSRIIAEVLMSDPSYPTRSVPDFKFFCFNGTPRVVGISTDRWGDNRHDFFDMRWNPVDYGISTKPRSDPPLKMPPEFSEMIQMTKKLATGFPFVRVDLYRHQGRIIFGEMTFSPSAGNMPIRQPDADLLWGSWLTLPMPNVKR